MVARRGGAGVWTAGCQGGAGAGSDAGRLWSNWKLMVVVVLVVLMLHRHGRQKYLPLENLYKCRRII